MFFGGAGEIGGPFCAGLRGKNLATLIDCGMEAKREKALRLPDFAAMKEYFEPTHVLNTHGHLDHVGGEAALIRNGIVPRQFYKSVLAREFAPIHGEDTIHITIRNWCQELGITPRQLFEKLNGPRADGEHLPIDWEMLCTQIMSGAAQKILAAEGFIGENCVLPFGFQDLRDLEYLSETVTAGKPFKIGNTLVTPYNVGHIMDALGYLIEVGGKRIFFTGDFSREATGYELVKKLDPGVIGPVDVLVINTTYACQPLEPFKTVSERFRSDLAADMAAGRRVVACGFFVDRGAKVALEIEKADLAEYLHVDGKVRDGLSIYEPHTGKLTGIEKYFVSDKEDNRAQLVRSRIKNGQPAIYLVSSGMGVEGSLSNNYIGEHLHDPNAVIYRLGWCEPGTPLDDLSIAAQNGRVVNWRGQFTKFECGVRSYQFSAHATSAEIAQTIKDFHPKTTLMVHGAPRRLEQFKKENTDLPGEIVIAENGRPYKLF